MVRTGLGFGGVKNFRGEAVKKNLLSEAPKDDR
jgi:hypothetical protein